MTHYNQLPGLSLREHVLDVPLDHQRPGAGRISLFGREVVQTGREAESLPWLVFLQGGPGFGAPRPLDASGFVGRAAKDYRVLLLDQRGTGRSTPVTTRTMERLETPRAQADYLSLFRADSIVADCESVRRTLVGSDTPWTVLGQSYGGFCSVSYLSQAPSGLAATIITGGLPPLDAHPDDIYRRTYRRVRAQNEKYYARYPGDEARVRAIVEHLREHEERLPRGGVLSPRKLQQLGLNLGFHDGLEQIHYLMEQAWVEGKGQLSRPFLLGFEQLLPYDTNPIFSVLHEAAYCQGFASRWSAERVRPEFPEFDADGDGPLFFTGEMIYPWMFEEWEQLRPFQAAAELLAERDDWPRLYDREALLQNETPAVAVVYDEDMYVERSFSDDTAVAIRGIRTWVTNEYPHSGLRAAGDAVLSRLLDMLQGRA